MNKNLLERLTKLESIAVKEKEGLTADSWQFEEILMLLDEEELPERLKKKYERTNWAEGWCVKYK